MKRYILIHKSDGIFLGHAMGLAFFSVLDAVGQTQAVTFESLEAGHAFLAETGNVWTPELVRFEPVECATDGHATCDELEAAGFKDLLGDMRLNELREAVPQGRA